MGRRSETTSLPVGARRFLIPRLTLAQQRNLTGYIFILPFVLGFLIWFLIPAGIAAYLVVQKWDLITAPEFVGTWQLSIIRPPPAQPLESYHGCCRPAAGHDAKLHWRVAQPP